MSAALSAVVTTSVALAGPASAGVPTGWGEGDPMTVLGLLTVILFIPLLIALIISLVVLLPGVLRGEGLIPKAPVDPETQMERVEH